MAPVYLTDTIFDQTSTLEAVAKVPMGSKSRPYPMLAVCKSPTRHFAMATARAARTRYRGTFRCSCQFPWGTIQSLQLRDQRSGACLGYF
jgi:hypothetical protein